MLGAFGYTTNEAVLHTDASLLPRRRAARASWNYRVGDDGRPTVTYYLNRLQAARRRDRLLRHAQRADRRRARDRAASSTTIRSTRSTTLARPARAADARPGQRHTALRGRAPRQRLPRGRPRVGRARRAALGVDVVSSALYAGTLVHARRTPARNVFRYPVSYWLARPRRAPRARAAAAALLGEPPERRLAPRRRPLRRRPPAEGGRDRVRAATRRSSACSC